MARSRNSFPSYLEHKQSGKARIVWTDTVGVRHFRMLPGPFDSTESRAEFARLQLELATAPVAIVADPGIISVNEVLLAFMEWALTHYRDLDGKPTGEIGETEVVAEIRS